MRSQKWGHHSYRLIKCTSHPTHRPTCRVETAHLTLLTSWQIHIRLLLPIRAEQTDQLQHPCPEPQTELLMTGVRYRLSGQHTLLGSAASLFDRRAAGRAAVGCQGCHIDWSDLHLLLSAAPPSGFQQYPHCSATLHMVQLEREITLLYTNCQNHLFFNLRSAGDRNYSLSFYVSST